MQTPNIGKLIDGPANRDAIHIAIAPVTITDEYTRPGDHVGIIDGDRVSKKMPHIGIIDPFLSDDEDLIAGQRCWLFLYPQSITTLRHEWTHPAFELAPLIAIAGDKAASEKWLREFIATADCPDYETTIKAAIGENIPSPDPEYYSSGVSRYDEVIVFNGRDAHCEIPPKFWDHVEIVTGVKIPQPMRAESFSCSC